MAYNPDRICTLCGLPKWQCHEKYGKPKRSFGSSSKTLQMLSTHTLLKMEQAGTETRMVQQILKERGVS